MRAASWSRRPRTFRCISDRRRSRCARRSRISSSSRGDVAALNDPFAGGTHLPDLTVVAPVFIGSERRPFAYAANRAHHADIGGIAPGSMALATEIYQEGFRLPPVKIVAGGEIARDVMTLFLANTRVREEREGDLRAQIAALSVGSERLLAIVKTSGRKTVEAAMDGLKDYAERLMIAALERDQAGNLSRRGFSRRRRLRHGADSDSRRNQNRRRQGDRRFHRLGAAGARHRSTQISRSRCRRLSMS